jgi:hypothetical protein
MPETNPMSEKDVRTWSMLCHLAALIGFVFPFGNVLGPLIVWLIKKDDSPQVDRQGRMSLNFQISWTIYMVVAAFLIILVIGLILLPLLALTMLILVIIAGVKVNNGEDFKYPLTIKFLKVD